MTDNAAQNSGEQLPSIAVITTGGTIGSRTDSRGVITVDSPLPAWMTRTLASTTPLCTTSISSALNQDSSHNTFVDIDTILAAIDVQLSDDNIDGVVILHGTDTLEDTVMACDLKFATDKPIIFTCAQRPSDHPEFDGGENLYDAISLACNPLAAGMGTLVACARAILQARGLQKWHTQDLVAFSRNCPESAHGASELKPPAIHFDTLADQIIPIVCASSDIPPGLLEFYRVNGASGFIIQGLGAGNIPDSLATQVESLRSSHPQIPVVISTRVPRGSTETSYGHRGGGAWLATHGVLPGGFLRPPQLRVLLAALLASGCDIDSLEMIWATYISLD